MLLREPAIQGTDDKKKLNKALGLVTSLCNRNQEKMHQYIYHQKTKLLTRLIRKYSVIASTATESTNEKGRK